GYLLNHYISNIFAPHLVAEFGWSRSEFALIGTFGLLTLFCVPVIGRLTDLFGARAIALVGVVSFPLSLIAASMMNGSIVVFAAITVLQTVMVGTTTSSLVYTRLIAENFAGARG